VIVHYRDAEDRLPMETRPDIHIRWLSVILDIDQQRHGTTLSKPRDESTRVQGCCRDHTLFCVGVLRQHGIAARSRVGDELLLWDDWGAMTAETSLTDEIAALLVAADQADLEAESKLAMRYTSSDARLRPGAHVTRQSPYGDAPVQERIGCRSGMGR
jgi:hypothetical protein